MKKKKQRRRKEKMKVWGRKTGVGVDGKGREGGRRGELEGKGGRVACSRLRPLSLLTKACDEWRPRALHSSLRAHYSFTDLVFMPPRDPLLCLPPRWHPPLARPPPTLFHAFPFSGSANCARALRQRYQRGDRGGGGGGAKWFVGGWGWVGGRRVRWWCPGRDSGRGQVRERCPPLNGLLVSVEDFWQLSQPPPTGNPNNLRVSLLIIGPICLPPPPSPSSLPHPHSSSSS